MLDASRIFSTAGNYIAHGIRHRASELVTLELGPQTEIDVARKLASEVEAERLTRLDRMLIAESREHGITIFGRRTVTNTVSGPQVRPQR